MERAIPPDSDLYIPRKATSEVWRAFRLSYNDPSRAWCTVCHLWLTVRALHSSISAGTVLTFPQINNPLTSAHRTSAPLLLSGAVEENNLELAPTLQQLARHGRRGPAGAAPPLFAGGRERALAARARVRRPRRECRLCSRGRRRRRRRQG